MEKMFKTTAVKLFMVCVLWFSMGSAADCLEGDPFADDDTFSSAFDETTEPKKADGITLSPPLQTDVHGYIESRNRFRLDDGKGLSTRQRVWLELDSTLNLHEDKEIDAPYRFFASGAADADPAAADLSHDHDLARLYIEEAFVTIDRPGWDLVLGKKIQRIGTGDGINPMDLINPVNFRDPVANGRSDSRLATGLALASVQLPHSGAIQEALLEAVFIPLAAVNRLNAPGSAWEGTSLGALRQKAADGELILNDQDEPGRYFEQSEFGVRLAATFSGWDVSLMGLSGYKDEPVFSISTTQVREAEKLVLTPLHPRFCALGLAFAKGFERTTLRGELAVKPDLPLTAATPGDVSGFLRRPVTEGVVGIDHTFGVNLYTNVQYFFIITDDAGSTVNDTFSQGVTYEVHDKFFRDALKSGVRGIVSFSGEGLTFETFAEYQPLDDWLFSLSLLFFEGPKDGSYGMFDRNDAVTLIVKYSF